MGSATVFALTVKRSLLTFSVVTEGGASPRENSRAPPPAPSQPHPAQLPPPTAAASLDMESRDGSGKKTKIDWKQKCVEEFRLLPLPHGAVDLSDNGVWKRYHAYRLKFPAFRPTSDESDADTDGTTITAATKEKPMRSKRYYHLKKIVKRMEMVQGEFGMLRKWLYRWDKLFTTMDEDVAAMLRKTPPPCHLILDFIEWDDDEIRSAAFRGRLWSPFAVPHCLVLKHRYHYRARQSSLEFSSTFEHTLFDFSSQEPASTSPGCDDVDSAGDDDDNAGDVDDKHIETEDRMKPICDVCFEDERLRLDVIADNSLNFTLVKKLMKHLYGTGLDPNHPPTAYNFMRLLLASLGVFDYKTLKAPYDGWVWSPLDHSPLQNEIIDEGSLPGKDDDALPFSSHDDEKGSLPDTDDDDSSTCVSWLEYAIRKATKSLRPLDENYRRPCLEDAPGYKSNTHRRADLEDALEHDNKVEVVLQKMVALVGDDNPGGHLHRYVRGLSAKGLIGFDKILTECQKDASAGQFLSVATALLLEIFAESRRNDDSSMAEDWWESEDEDEEDTKMPAVPRR